MANFEQAVDKVLKLEGGYQNSEADWGNYNSYDKVGNLVPYAERPGKTLRAGTNRGISAGFLSGKLGRQVSVDEIKAITQGYAVSLYKTHFWDRVLGDQIENQDVANVVFDAYVLHSSWGVKLAQIVLNQAWEAGLTEDGIMGPKTLASLNAADPGLFIRRYLQARREFVQKLAAQRPGNDQFLAGWLKRLEKFEPAGTEVAAQNGKAPNVLIPILLGGGLLLLAFMNERR